MWAQDYCTVCDKVCPSGSVYCSDGCRAFEKARSHGAGAIPEPSAAWNGLYGGRQPSLRTPCVCESKCTCMTPASSATPLTPEPARFLYDSPLLKPAGASSGAGSSSAQLSPPPSPLLIAEERAIPHAAAANRDVFSYSLGASRTGKSLESSTPRAAAGSCPSGLAYTADNYRRWLTAIY